MDDAGTMALTEYNAETPAGAGYNDALVASFADLPIMRAFGRRYEALPLLARHGVLHVLLDAYQEWSGRREIPRIAIVDWPEVPTRSEFVLFQEYFRAVGIEAVIADPREMELRGGRLYAGGGPVDLVYKRVLLARAGGALRGRDAAAPGGREPRGVHGEPAALQDPPQEGEPRRPVATSATRRSSRRRSARSIAAHIPWTRVMEERRTEHGGKAVDLVPFVLALRERLVLKPNDDYGGAGIVLGWDGGRRRRGSGAVANCARVSRTSCRSGSGSRRSRTRAWWTARWCSPTG